MKSWDGHITLKMIFSVFLVNGNCIKNLICFPEEVDSEEKDLGCLVLVFPYIQSQTAHSDGSDPLCVG